MLFGQLQPYNHLESCCTRQDACLAYQRPGDDQRMNRGIYITGSDVVSEIHQRNEVGLSLNLDVSTMSHVHAPMEG